MIYYMDTKTLVKDFTKVHTPKEILDCTFVIFSSRICPNKNMKRISYSNRCFYLLEEDMGFNLRLVRKEITSSLNDMDVIIRMMREAIVFPDKIFIILSTPKEVKTKCPRILALVLEEMFGYPIIDYKNGKYLDYKYDPKECVDKLSFWSAYFNKQLIGQNPELLKDLDKKKKKKTLKILGRYEKGMSNSEMNAILTEDGLPFKL